METVVNNEGSVRSVAGAELYVNRPVRLSGTWIDVAIYKKATVTFIADSQYYDPSSQIAGTFDVNLEEIFDQAMSVGTSLFTHTYVLGMGNTAGNAYVRFNIDVDTSAGKIQISAVNTSIVSSIKVMLEK